MVQGGWGTGRGVLCALGRARLDLREEHRAAPAGLGGDDKTVRVFQFTP
jgi:hypothetical protein